MRDKSRVINIEKIVISDCGEFQLDYTFRFHSQIMTIGMTDEL